MNELIIAAIAGGGLGSVVSLITALITRWALRDKIDAETEEIEGRVRTSVIESFQSHIDFLNGQIVKLQAQVKVLQEENERLRAKNLELEARLERYRHDVNSSE